MDIELFRSQMELSWKAPQLEIASNSDNYAEIIANKFIIKISFDERDDILVSSVRPFLGDARLDTDYDVLPLLHMLGFMDDDDELKINKTNDILREINNIGTVLRGIFYVGPEKIRDAFYFLEGYCAGHMVAMDGR